MALDFPSELNDRAGTGPLVTFALFAYNQEKYVREAIEAAFAQTHQPLEIILSDDCSADGTFAIMQEMASQYVGPHKVIARQSPKNRGLLRHVLDVANEARGTYMVVAAGDDISFPQRAARLSAHMENEQADFGWSAYNRIEESVSGYRHYHEKYDLKGRIFGLSVSRMVGATAVYRTNVVKTIERPDHPIFYEDNFFEIFSEIKGFKISFCRDELLSYRVLPESLSMNFYSSAENFETRMMTHFSRLSDTVAYALAAFADADTRAKRPELTQFEKSAVFFKAASGWREMSLWDRMSLLLKAPDRKSFRWFAPRAALGWSSFIALKNLQLKNRASK
jgi:glycosyltransferase involved in cell wall biosynthesis